MSLYPLRITKHHQLVYCPQIHAAIWKPSEGIGNLCPGETAAT